MDKIAMLNGLSGKDFSALGTILATAATGAAVHGLMYPMTEFVYGLSDNFIKNVIPNNWRKPLPQGYRPQTIKIDKPNFKDKNKEWDEIRKVMDQLDGEQLRGFTLTLSPEYINDAYRYLVAIRGINPGDENKPYLSIFKNIGLNFSENNEPSSENNEPSSEEKEPSSEEKEPSSKENKLFDEKLDKMKNLGGAAGVAALVGAGTLAMSPVYKEEDRSKNRRRALRNALIGGGLYYLAKNAGLKGSGESTSGESTSGDKSEEDEDDDEDEAEKWFKDHLYTKDYISEDQESDNPKHLGYTWNGSPIYGPTWDKDMSMLNGLFGTPKDFGIKKKLAGIGVAAGMLASLYGGFNGLSQSNIQRENLNSYKAEARYTQRDIDKYRDKANEATYKYMTTGIPFERQRSEGLHTRLEDAENHLKNVNSKIEEIKKETPSKIASETAKGAAKGAGVGAGAGSLIVAAGEVAKALNNKKKKDDPQNT